MYGDGKRHPSNLGDNIYDWGLGFTLGALDHKLRFGHIGSTEGFRADFEALIKVKKVHMVPAQVA